MVCQPGYENVTLVGDPLALALYLHLPDNLLVPIAPEKHEPYHRMKLYNQMHLKVKTNFHEK